MPKQVYGNNRPGAGRNRRFDRPSVKVKGLRININEDRLGADDADTLRGGNKTKRAGDDLIARFNSHGAQTKNQGVRPRVAGDRMFNADHRRHFLLEGLHFRPKDKLSQALDALDSLEERMAYVDDEDAMRDTMPYFRTALTFRSVVRLARVVLAIKQRDEPLPRIEDYFPDGGMPLDAFTGKPFLYERTEDGAFIAAGKEASRESLLEDALAWEIRYD